MIPHTRTKSFRPACGQEQGAAERGTAALDAQADRATCTPAEKLDALAAMADPIKPDQRRAFQEMQKDGATIVGKGKPGFPAGMKVPATQVQIWRPSRQP
jgi:hypothetical protein